MVLEDILDQIIKDAVRSLYCIFDVFKDYYTPERVDLHLPTEQLKEHILSSAQRPIVDIYSDLIGLEEELSRTVYELNNIATKLDSTTSLRDICDEAPDLNATFSTSHGIYLIGEVIELVCGAICKLYAEGDIYILVHWPEVTVTNERGESININDLYAKVPLNIYGQPDGYFELIRSTYTIDQWTSRYTHSHVPSHNPKVLPEFKGPCLGAGPIRGTIARLKRSNTPDYNRWSLFCLELDKYVRVESIAGTPYIRMSSINKSSTYIQGASGVSKPRTWGLAIRSFLGYMVDNMDSLKLQYGYANGHYHIAISFAEFSVRVSNLFIEWMNTVASPDQLEEILQKYGSMGTYIIEDDRIYPTTLLNTSMDKVNDLQGTTLFMFKGIPVKFRVIDAPSISNTSTITLLNLGLLGLIYTHITKIVNLTYGRTEESVLDANTKFSL